MTSLEIAFYFPLGIDLDHRKDMANLLGLLLYVMNLEAAEVSPHEFRLIFEYLFERGLLDGLGVLYQDRSVIGFAFYFRFRLDIGQPQKAHELLLLFTSNQNTLRIHLLFRST